MPCCVCLIVFSNSAGRPVFVEQMMREGLEARQRAKQQTERGHGNVSAYTYICIVVSKVWGGLRVNSILLLHATLFNWYVSSLTYPTNFEVREYHLRVGLSA